MDRRYRFGIRFDWPARDSSPMAHGGASQDRLRIPRIHLGVAEILSVEHTKTGRAFKAINKVVFSFDHNS